MSTQRIALVAGRFRDGGVERWITRLATGMSISGQPCDVIVGERPSDPRVPAAVGVWRPEGRESLKQVLRRYLEACNPPPVLLPFRTTDFSLVIELAERASPPARVYLTTGTFIRERLGRASSSLLRSWKARLRLRYQWSRACGVIAVSPEVAKDWLKTGYFAPEHVHAPAPPVAGSDLLDASLAPVDHPWFREAGVPVVLGVGRLHHQKGFDRLIAGIARVRQHRDVRLVLLGQGEEEQGLRNMAASYEISDHVDFPGFVDNPYSWLRRANLVVAPSRTETFGFVLVESMYVGTPFVADAAPPGPRSIRNATGYGDLVDCDNVDALAETIERNLSEPPAAAELREAARAFDSEHSASEYLSIINGR